MVEKLSGLVSPVLGAVVPWLDCEGSSRMTGFMGPCLAFHEALFLDRAEGACLWEREGGGASCDGASNIKSARST
jgi:hypothetical protein